VFYGIYILTSQSEAFLQLSKHVTLLGEVFSPSPNPHPGGPSFPVYNPRRLGPSYTRRLWVARDLGSATYHAHNNCEPMRGSEESYASIIRYYHDIETAGISEL